MSMLVTTRINTEYRISREYYRSSWPKGVYIERKMDNGEWLHITKNEYAAWTRAVTAILWELTNEGEAP